jgi:hypothetical protein
MASLIREKGKSRFTGIDKGAAIPRYRDDLFP